MKRIVFTGLMLCLFGSTLYAQTYLVPKAGVSISKFAPAENEENVSSLAGFTGGLGINILMGEKFSLQPELLFIQKGANYEFKQGIGDGILQTATTDIRVNYLELPVLAKFTFGEGKVKYYVNAGPSLSYGLGGKTDYSINWTLGNETVYQEQAEGDVKFDDYPEEYPAQDVYFQRRLDVGVQVGGGVILYKKVIVDARYGYGFTKLDDEAQPKNRAIQITVGAPLYSFFRTFQ
jgi:hypothetical protein